MDVINQIDDELYRKIIDYAFKTCDTVMFAVNNFWSCKEARITYYNNMKKMKEKLHSSLLKSCYSRRGKFYETIDSETMISNGYTEILVYKLDENIKDFLLTRNYICCKYSLSYPEDITIFRNGYAWLRCINHEKLCFIYYDSDYEYEELTKLGIKFREKEIVPPEYRYYYDDYGITIEDKEKHAD